MKKSGLFITKLYVSTSGSEIGGGQIQSSKYVKASVYVCVYGGVGSGKQLERWLGA